MLKREIQLTADFKNRLIKSVYSIVFFIFTYVIVLLFSFALTALCIYLGLWLIAIRPMFLTLMLGAGLASIGFLILIFLLKFIFKKHTIDRSHLTEITRNEEPALFSMIDEIVLEVGTTFPKKVYLSTDVNACVFYDSSFWSMFLPVKKNLQIGLGLVNAITKEELKAILAHEFGHFSQRSMKVGSYVYNVNQVIFNMLYDNESYEKIIQKWSSVSGYFYVFIIIAIKLIEGVQWIFSKMYSVVNKSYMALSREMEFHADEIAASITGFEPLKKSLLRMSLADKSYTNVLNFYSEKISQNIKTDNIYTNQALTIRCLAELNDLKFINSLPDISIEEQRKFDKSKLIITDQWASHPTIEDRINRLEKTGFSNPNQSDVLANTVFTNIEELQKKLTDKLFQSVKYQGNTINLNYEAFEKEYKEEVVNNSFSKIYNSYYDNKNPINFNISTTNKVEEVIHFDQLFSSENVDKVYQAIALQNDKETLLNIVNNVIEVNTFDYDGKRYQQKQAQELAEQLDSEYEKLQSQIEENDRCIYQYFFQIEQKQSTSNKLQQLYTRFFEFDAQYKSKCEIYNQLFNDLQFVNVTTPFEEITLNFFKNEPQEKKLKNEIEQLLNEEILVDDITVMMREQLTNYATNKLVYFSENAYNNDNLQILYQSLHNYAFLLSRKYFLLKKSVLCYQESLL